MERGKMTITGLDEIVQTVEEVEYGKIKDCYYMMYQENLEGFEEYSSRIKCKEGYLEIVRSGPREVRMVYEQGKEYCMRYPSPYGDVEIKISTSTVKLLEDSKHITVLVECTLGDVVPKKLCVKLEK